MNVSQDSGLDTLFRAHYERIARVIGRIIHDQARAEELAVEVFLKWNRNPAAHGEHAEGWLYRAAVREGLDEWRRQSRRAAFERVLQSVLRTPPTPEQLYRSASDQQSVRAVLASLSHRTAAVLLLWAEGLSYRDIAAAIQANPTYIGSLLARAQQEFRKEYERRYGTNHG